MQNAANPQRSSPIVSSSRCKHITSSVSQGFSELTWQLGHNQAVALLTPACTGEGCEAAAAAHRWGSLCGRHVRPSATSLPGRTALPSKKPRENCHGLSCMAQGSTLLTGVLLLLGLRWTNASAPTPGKLVLLCFFRLSEPFLSAVTITNSTGDGGVLDLRMTHHWTSPVKQDKYNLVVS